MMSQTNWEADKMLDVYIHDYFLKRKLHASAKAFQAEAKVSTEPVAIDAPGGFLFEWWSVFWDIFIARTNEKHSEAAASYIETQLIKAREQQQQQQQHHQQQQQQHHQQQQQQQHQQQQKPQQQQQHQMQMQQLLLQRHVQQQQQQQRRDGTQLLNGPSNGLVGNDALMRQNPATANTLATKMYEERLKLPLQRDALDDAAMKQRFGDNVSQLLDPNHASLLKSAAIGGRPPGQTLHGAPGGISGNLQQVQSRNQLQVPSDIKSEMNPIMNPRAAGSEGTLIGVHGSNQGGNNLTLKGWPLTGLDHLRTGILQQQKSMMQSSQPFHQLQLQQQLLLQAQQNLASPSASDLECRKFRMLLNGRNSLGKDGQLNAVGDVVANVGSPMQVGCPVLPRADTDMLIKLQQQQLQNNNQQQQHYLQHPLSSQQSQSSNPHLQQDKMIGSGSIGLDGSIPNTFRGNDQSSKSQMGRKRKQPVSSSGPANSSGTGNTAGPSPSSAPSTPSTHTPGDAISMPTMSHNGGSSKSLLMYGSDGMTTLTSAPNQLADVDRCVDDGSLDDNIESFLAHEDGDPRETVGRSVDGSKGFSFSEFRCITASTSKVECCHFSSDGKLLATGGQDKKAVLWCTESFTAKATLDEHSQMITDVRFSPSLLRLATSSADKTVRVWDVDNPGYSLRTFTGHSTSVTSLDFHPNREDLICSCDGNGEIRYWSITNGSYTRVFKGGMNQVRFQPRLGRYLAAAAEGIVSILDVENQNCRQKLLGHKNHVSVCWDSSGEYLATVSEDLIKVWSVGCGGKMAECIHELNYSGNKFNSCAFHPTYTSLLVIGCYQSLELWNVAENKTMTLAAHDKLISSLAVSGVNGLVASASHDKCVKFWK